MRTLFHLHEEAVKKITQLNYFRNSNQLPFFIQYPCTLNRLKDETDTDADVGLVLM